MPFTKVLLICSRQHELLRKLEFSSAFACKKRYALLHAMHNFISQLDKDNRSSASLSRAYQARRGSIVSSKMNLRPSSVVMVHWVFGWALLSRNVLAQLDEQGLSLNPAKLLSN